MFSHLKLGLKPHDHARVDRHVKLTPALAGVDQLVSRTPKDWALGRAWDDDPLLNNDLGICGPAALVNWLKMMTLACGRGSLVFDEGDALAAYRAMGYDGTPATDTGVVLLELMQWWTDHPIGGVQLDCFFVVGFLDPAHLAMAQQIAPLIVGADLTTACQTTDTWDGNAANEPTDWGGHAYLYHSDSPGGGNGKSWGQPVYTTPDFRVRRWRECYLPICRELMPAGTDVLRLLNIAKGL
jgi:hypothetical protein